VVSWYDGSQEVHGDAGKEARRAVVWGQGRDYPLEDPSQGAQVSRRWAAVCWTSGCQCAMGDLRVSDDGPVDEDTLKKVLADSNIRQARLDRASRGGGGRYSESVDRPPTKVTRRKSLTSAASKDFYMLADIVLRQAEISKSELEK